MKKIENYEEFINLWNINHKNRYWGNKKISPEHEQEIIEKANIKDFKRYSIYMLDDNYHFIVIDTKWAIDKDLYYDDEQEPPKVTLNYFKTKNQVNIKYTKIDKEETIKPYFIINYSGNDKEVCINRDIYYLSNYYDDLKWAQDKNLFVSFLTDDEVKDYNSIVDELNKQYDKRLENYYKKYNQNIFAIGYWVNR